MGMYGEIRRAHVELPLGACPECGGEGQIPHDHPHYEADPVVGADLCPQCDGTGSGVGWYDSQARCGDELRGFERGAAAAFGLLGMFEAIGAQCSYWGNEHKHAWQWSVRENDDVCQRCGAVWAAWSKRYDTDF